MRPVQVEAATKLLVAGALVHEPLGEQIRVDVELPEVMSLGCRHELCITELIKKVAHLLVSNAKNGTPRNGTCREPTPA